MRIRLGHALVVVAAMALLGSSCATAAAAKPRSTPKKTATSYIVVEVSDTHGDISYAVIGTKDYPARVKQAREAYQQELKAWTKARTDARKAKTPFKQSRPKPGSVKRLGSTYPTQERAKAYADKLTQKLEEKKAPAEDKKPDKGKVEPVEE